MEEWNTGGDMEDESNEITDLTIGKCILMILGQDNSWQDCGIESGKHETQQSHEHENEHEWG